MPEGFQPKAPHLDDYEKGLRRYVEAAGGDPEHPTEAEDEAFRKTRAGIAAAGRATDTTRTTETTDPFGQKTTTKSTLERRPAGVATPETGQPQATTPVKSPGQQKKDLQGIVSKGKPQLDAQGHIPDTAKVNPNLREAANNILDGMDITKLPIPQRDRAAAEELARSYGWKGQGLFAPGDMMRVRNSLAIINDFDKGDTLSIFDDAVSRQKIGQAIQNVEKRNMVGQAFQTWIAQNLNPAEQRYVRTYLQAVGRISGLSAIVRSGRPTEATIERLKSELPNPAYAGSADAARAQLDLLHDEINIAMDKGQFSDQAPSSGKSNDDSNADEILKKHGVL